MKNVIRKYGRNMPIKAVPNPEIVNKYKTILALKTENVYVGNDGDNKIYKQVTVPCLEPTGELLNQYEYVQSGISLTPFESLQNRIAVVEKTAELFGEGVYYEDESSDDLDYVEDDKMLFMQRLEKCGKLLQELSSLQQQNYYGQLLAKSNNSTPDAGQDKKKEELDNG